MSSENIPSGRLGYRFHTALAVLLALASAFIFAPFEAAAAPKQKQPLKNVPVSGILADGGTFNGKVSITKFGYDQTSGLWVSGKLIGTATTADGVVHKDISQSFSQVHATLTSGGSATSSSTGVPAFAAALQASCGILDLDVGAINLDLLGLVVDLSPIHLDITAVSGAGNLLGNLLCAVVGLLDPNGFLTDLIGNLTQLLNLLNQINQLL
jgi:hypothetical protein